MQAGKTPLDSIAISVSQATKDFHTLKAVTGHVFTILTFLLILQKTVGFEESLYSIPEIKITIKYQLKLQGYKLPCQFLSHLAPNSDVKFINISDIGSCRIFKYSRIHYRQKFKKIMMSFFQIVVSVFQFRKGRVHLICISPVQT